MRVSTTARTILVPTDATRCDATSAKTATTTHSAECISPGGLLENVSPPTRGTAEERGRTRVHTLPRCRFLLFFRVQRRCFANKRDRFSYLAAEPKPTASEGSRDERRRRWRTRGENEGRTLEDLELARPKRQKRKKERGIRSPQTEDRPSKRKKGSFARLPPLPFMRAGPLILYGSRQDPTEMHRGNLHTRSSGISSTTVAILPRLLVLSLYLPLGHPPLFTGPLYPLLLLVFLLATRAYASREERARALYSSPKPIWMPREAKFPSRSFRKSQRTLPAGPSGNERYKPIAFSARNNGDELRSPQPTEATEHAAYYLQRPLPSYSFARVLNERSGCEILVTTEDARINEEPCAEKLLPRLLH